MKGITPVERVLKAICYEATDRIPKGELLVEESFLNKIYPEERDAPYREKLMRLAEEAGLDVITLRVEWDAGKEELEEIIKWRIHTDYFIMTIVNGVFWRNGDPISFEDFILGILDGNDGVKNIIDTKKENAIRVIKRCLDCGAHGIIIGDDIAYNKGPFLSPQDLNKWIFPALKEINEEIKKDSGIAFLHTCGNVTTLVDLIISSGFDGLHGLAPSEGNNPIEIHRKTKNKITLMGIIEVDLLEPSKVEALKRDILSQIAKEGGYILGSTGGLSENTPLASFRALYFQGMDKIPSPSSI
jgi:uroporphyrinogen decarboxylase